MNVRVRGVFAVATALTCVVLCASCSRGDVSEEAQTPATSPATPPTASSATPISPTLTASSLQPPAQDNRYTHAGGRPKVVIDPCTWIPDDIVRAAGLDPLTRKRGKDLIAEYTFLTCDFATGRGQPEWSLQVDSGNVSLDEVRRKYAGRYTDIQINGREAVQTVKNSSESCAVDLRTSVGYLGLQVLHGWPEPSSASPCDKVMEFARIIEPIIGSN